MLSAIGLTLAVMAQALSPIAAQAAEAVKVGLILPMSGKYSIYGQEMSVGFNHVIDEINAAGGIKSLGGAKIKVILSDDTSQPGVASLAARRLVFEDKVTFLAGFPITSLINAILPISDQNGVPMLSFAGGRAGIGKHFFTLVFQFGDGYAGNFVNFLDYANKSQNLGVKNVVIASSDSEPWKWIDREMETRLKELGYKIVGVVPIPSSQADLTPTLLKIRSLEPDAILSFLYAGDGIKLMNARYTLGYQGPLWIGGTGGYTDPSLWGKLGDTVAAATLNKNLFGLTGYAATDSLVAAADLITRVRKGGVKIPLGFNFLVGAQSAQVVASALEIAGSTEPAKIEKAMKTVKFAAGDTRLYLPKPRGFSFKDDGTMEDQTGLIIQWEGGKQVVVWPSSYATRAPRITKK